MNETAARRFAERDRVFLEFDQASFELVLKKCDLDQESFE
jgi:hypothetical protein